jgi:hypothetical protein
MMIFRTHSSIAGCIMSVLINVVYTCIIQILYIYENGQLQQWLTVAAAAQHVILNTSDNHQHHLQNLLVLSYG